MGGEDESWEGESCYLLSLAKNEANREEGEEERVTRGRRQDTGKEGGKWRRMKGEEKEGGRRRRGKRMNNEEKKDKEEEGEELF